MLMVFCNFSYWISVTGKYHHNFGYWVVIGTGIGIGIHPCL